MLAEDESAAAPILNGQTGVTDELESENFLMA